jgi:uncharacterized membrane protein YkgB
MTSKQDDSGSAHSPVIEEPAREHGSERLPDRTWPAIPFAGRALERLASVAGRAGIPLLRWALALVYIWFGALKVADRSDISGLVAATVPWLPQHVFVPVLGGVEMLLGLGLLAGRARRLVLLAVLAHLVGTFLTFIDAQVQVFHGLDPLLLTVNGEFVLKNLVLISAALVLMGLTSPSAGSSPGRRGASEVTVPADPLI